MSNRKRIPRRQFLKGAAYGAGAITLAACGAGEVPSATTPSTAASTAASAAPSGAASASTAASTAGGAAVELTHWDWFVTAGPAYEEEIRLFQEANPGITVKKVTNQVDQYSDLFALAERSGDAPDVFAIPQKPTFAEFVANGSLADLTQFPDFETWKNTFPDPVQNFAEGTNTIDGKTYSAPYGNTRDAMWLQLYINNKVFKDAGLVDAQGKPQIPQTADEMLAAARTIKEKSGGQVYGYGFGGTTDTPGWTLWAAQLSGGDNSYGGLDYRTGKFSYGSNPAFKAAVDTLVALRDEGLILPDSASVDDEAIRVLFAQGRFGMLLGGSWMVGGWKKTNPDFTEYSVSQVPFFGTTEPKSYFYTSPGGSNYAINPKSKNLAAAWTWFKWLYSKESAERLVKVGNGTSVFPEANKPEYAGSDAERTLIELGPQYSRVGPRPELRNPDAAKVQPAAVKPGEADVVKGIFTGQLTDVSKALADLDAAKQAALETAIADAKSAGANVSIDDFIFADWDPTKDYVTKAR